MMISKKKTEIESREMDIDPITNAEFSTNNGWEKYQIDEISVMAISDNSKQKTQKHYRMTI